MISLDQSLLRNNSEGKIIDSHAYLGNRLHDETAAWHSASMHADALDMQGTCRSCMGEGQEDPKHGKIGTF